jgi:type I restriction enzyme S subunit
MAASLPLGTTAPRGLPKPALIRWPLVAARDLFELKYGKALVEAHRRPGHVPVYGTNGRCGSHDEALFRGPGVILGRKGQGPLGVEWSDDDYWVIDTAYSLAPLRADIELRYAYFLIKFIGLNHLKDGTSNPTLSRDTFGAQVLPLPPLGQQRAISHILGTLDDKIELNRRMNETLEAMARALFKSWFVDFLPVRAKMAARTQTGDPIRLPAATVAQASAKAEGRDPLSAVPGTAQAGGLPKPLTDLFPDSFEDSELGEVPKGWRVLPLAECVDAARGLSYKGSGLSDSGLPMHNLNSIYEGGGYKHEGIKHYEGDYRPHHLARAGDLIVANTEQGHNRLLIGYAAIVPARFDGESLFSHHIYRVRPRSSSGLTPDYLCHLLNTSVMHDTVSGYANGTTVNMLPIDGLQRPLVVVPPSVIVRAFDGFAEAARKRHGEMMDESRTLSTLRDTLLPKLISGELRVPHLTCIAGSHKP